MNDQITASWFQLRTLRKMCLQILTYRRPIESLVTQIGELRLGISDCQLELSTFEISKKSVCKFEACANISRVLLSNIARLAIRYQ